jgi:hypothetical protein
MRATEIEKYGAAPSLADIPVAGEGGQPHGHGGGQGGHDHGGGHSHSMESVRTATHCGHEIVIKTCYEITVNGKPLDSHLSVNDDGSLHSHALPEYSFTSAVDVVKKIVESFPDEFPCDDGNEGCEHPPAGGEGGSGHDHGAGGSAHGGHDHAHDHGSESSSSGQQGHGHGGHTHEHP